MHVTPSLLTSRSFSKSFETNDAVSWHGPHLTIVAPRVSLSELKYIRPKRRFCRRSAQACPDVIHCWVMSTWHVLHVWADWRLMVLRRSGGGVYAEAARARNIKAERWKHEVRRVRIKVA